MATTNAQQWNPNGINQENDAQYTADSLRSGGATNGGLLPSDTDNKFRYQTSTYIAALGQMLANKGFNNSDANLNTLSAVMANILTTADVQTGLQIVGFSGMPSFNGASYGKFQITLSGNVTGSYLACPSSDKSTSSLSCRMPREEERSNGPQRSSECLPCIPQRIPLASIA